MKTGQAIAQRRSIRKYKATPVPRELLEEILVAATLAPSGKNAQPWEFIILEGAEKNKLADMVIAGAEKMESTGSSSGSAKNSARVIKEAPLTILVFNPYRQQNEKTTGINKLLWSVHIQSVGAAIQNMLLKATELGLGSLWVCDVFFALETLGSWLNREDELIAAVVLGWPDEAPLPRPRKPWQSVTRWGTEDFPGNP